MADTSRIAGNFKDKSENAGATGAQGGAQSTLQRAGEAASSLGQQASETLSSAASKASNLASQVGQRAEDAVSSVGERMHDLGSSVRERGPQSGVLGSATSAVASGLETTGDYLHEQGISGMFEDVTALVRRFPIQSLLVGFGIGFLMARAMRRE
jgi:ElaB/YqjD/DUF883 family membrane-anchored ribosome-binding protein